MAYENIDVRQMDALGRALSTLTSSRASTETCMTVKGRRPSFALPALPPIRRVPQVSAGTGAISLEANGQGFGHHHRVYVPFVGVIFDVNCAQESRPLEAICLYF